MDQFADQMKSTDEQAKGARRLAQGLQADFDRLVDELTEFRTTMTKDFVESKRETARKINDA